MRRILRVLAWWTPPVCVAVCAAGIAATEGALRSGPRRLPAGLEARATALARSYGVAVSEATVRASDGAILRGSVFLRRPPANRAVIVLHGHGDTRAGTLGHARFFLQHGYDVLAPDSRWHGASGGDLITFGVRETDDLRRWAAWLRERTGAGGIFALGESMGAAVAVQAAAEESPLSAAAAECTFSSFRRAAYLRLGQRFGAGETLGAAFFPVVETASLYARMRYGVDLSSASPEEAARRLKIPLLLIHGAADGNIPASHSRLVRRAARGQVELWEVPGGGHTDALARAPDEFARRVLPFFDRAAARSTISLLCGLARSPTTY